MIRSAPSTDVSYYSNQLGTGAIVAIVILGVAVWVVFLIAYIQIIRKAGYSGWWILIMLVPLVNVIMLLVFAFKEWPVHRELQELRARVGQGGGYGTQPGYGAQSGYGSQPGYGGQPGYGNPAAPGDQWGSGSGGSRGNQS